MGFMVTTVDLEVQKNSQRLIQPQEPSKPPFDFGRLPSTMKVHPHHPPPYQGAAAEACER